MITSMHIENYKCFKDFDIELGPFNVLIGPNDSGKTAFLEAIRIVGTIPPLQKESAKDLNSQLGTNIGPQCVWRQKGSQIKIEAKVSSGVANSQGTFVITSANGESYKSDMSISTEVERVGRIGYQQFDPACLRKPSLVSQKLAPNGEGFAAFLDDILRVDRKAFFELENEFYARFPYYKGGVSLGKTQIPDLSLVSGVSVVEKIIRDAFVLQFKTVQGEVLSPESVSDGVMLSLAYLAISRQPNPPDILLLEEPENGVHYASLRDIVSTLREISEKRKVQIVLTTHSPYLLDLVRPEEVRVFQKDQEGAVHAKAMSEYPEVVDMTKHFNTGEIWTNLLDQELLGQKESK